MPDIGLTVAMYIFYLIAGVIPAAVIVFLFRKDIKLQLADYFQSFFPWLIWIGLKYLGVGAQSLSNIVEPMVFGPIVAVLVLLRCLVSMKIGQQKMLSWVALSLSILVALVSAIFFPNLKE